MYPNTLFSLRSVIEKDTFAHLTQCISFSFSIVNKKGNSLRISLKKNKRETNFVSL